MLRDGGGGSETAIATDEQRPVLHNFFATLVVCDHARARDDSEYQDQLQSLQKHDFLSRQAGNRALQENNVPFAHCRAILLLSVHRLQDAALDSRYPAMSRRQDAQR